MQEIIVGNERVSLGERLGGGNRGEVFRLKEYPGFAVKLYKRELRQNRQEKIRALVAAGLGQKTSMAAFPLEVVMSGTGEFLGFSMRLMSDRHELPELYDPKLRLRHFPEVDYRFVVRVALNVARAVGAMHNLQSDAAQNMECVIGELNHSGILVANDATVALINADNFQFKINGKTYPCVAGAPEFMPPELHGSRCKSIFRTHAHDCFGLAVAVFHLLFMGRHPYAGRCNDPSISLGKAIAQNRFAYSVNRRYATRMSPPPDALTLDRFPDSISRKFEEAFGLKSSARPSVAAWMDALRDFEGSLKRCGRVRTHYHLGNSEGCAWCELTENSAFDMFPDPSEVQLGARPKKQSAVSSPKETGSAGRGESSTSLSRQNDNEVPAARHELATSSYSCPRCGKANDPASKYCYACGYPFGDRMDPVPATGSIALPGRPAGFWIRLCAVAIDLIILGFLDVLLIEMIESETSYLTVSGILAILYWTLGVSEFGGTVGKRLLGLKVLRIDGNRCGFWRAFARYLCYALSILIVFVGFLMIGFRKDKRGLHDLICGTAVVWRKSGPEQ